MMCGRELGRLGSWVARPDLHGCTFLRHGEVERSWSVHAALRSEVTHQTSAGKGMPSLSIFMPQLRQHRRQSEKFLAVCRRRLFVAALHPSRRPRKNRVAGWVMIITRIQAARRPFLSSLLTTWAGYRSPTGWFRYPCSGSSIDVRVPRQGDARSPDEAEVLRLCRAVTEFFGHCANK
jgi:hypothetical protein